MKVTAMLLRSHVATRRHAVCPSPFVMRSFYIQACCHRLHRAEVSSCGSVVLLTRHYRQEAGRQAASHSDGRDVMEKALFREAVCSLMPDVRRDRQIFEISSRCVHASMNAPRYAACSLPL